MLDIHPKATENFNQKADQILAFITDIEPSNVHSHHFIQKHIQLFKLMDRSS